MATILLITFIFIALFFRLGYLQCFSSSFLNIKAAEQWLRDVPLKAKRGEIYDRNGVCLASSLTTYDVYVRANSVENSVETAKFLAEILELDEQKTLEKVCDKSKSEVKIKTQVDEAVAKTIIAKNLSGVVFSLNTKRDYAFGDLLTQVMGYTTIDGIGQSGLEAYYNELLTGVDGKILSEGDVIGRNIDSNLTYYQEPVPGLCLNLNIDCEIQNIVENVLEKVVLEQACKNVICVVMDPNTGGVIAMSTKPSFNLNDVPRDDVEMLNLLSKNYPVVNVVEPGSTFKLFTLSAALELGLTNENETFYCPGYRIVDGQRIKCWKTTGHGHQTLTEGVCNSCNCVFMDLAQRVGTERLYEYIKKFGFGSKTGIDCFAESSGILMPELNVKNVDLARIGFGHAVAVTPIQLITAVCSIVNGGTLYTPHIASSAFNESGEVKNFDPEIKNQTISQEISNIIKNMMKAVVEHADGANASIAGYQIGGKTGTAQKYENGVIAQGKYVSSFVGFGPFESAQYVVLLMVDEPSNGAYYGSIVAAPYAKEIFKNIFEIKNIEKANNDETLSCEMPDVVGKNVAEALSLIKKAGLYCEVDGEGTFVLEQLPKAGTKLKNGSVVLIKIGEKGDDG